MLTINDVEYLDQIEKAKRELSRGTYILITAPLKSGVTSFLQMLQKRLAEDYPGWNVIYIELSTSKDVTRQLDEAIQTSQPLLTQMGEPYGCSKGCCFIEGTGAMRVINKLSGKIVVILDGFHRVDQEQQKILLQHLRTTYYLKDKCERLRKLGFVLGGAINLDKIDPSKTSPFFANTTIELADFTLNESRSFIYRFFSEKLKTAHENVMLYLYDMTEGHPYLLANICQKLYDRSKSENTISLFTAQSIIEEILEGRDEYFDILSSELQRADGPTLDLLVRILGGSLVNESQNPALKELIRLGLVKISERSYIKLRNPMVECFVRKQTSLIRGFWGDTVAPMHEITIAMPALSEYNYRRLAHIQHLLRNFIVCKLHAQYGSEWLNKIDQYIVDDLHKQRNSDSSMQSNQPLLGYADLEQLQQLIVSEWSSVFQRYFGQRGVLDGFFDGLSLLFRKTYLGRELTHYDMAKVESMTEYFYQFMTHRSLTMTKDESSPLKRPITLLFLASNPIGTSRLDLEREIREIDQRLRMVEKDRNSFKIEQSGAAQYLDLQDTLQRYSPDIAHFSGHGNKDGQIMIRDESGNAQPIPIKALADLFKILKGNIRCVFLNACWSEKQAQAIARNIDCVIGMSRSISDQAAIIFAGSFYQAIGRGNNVKKAYELGCNAIAGMNIPEDAIPRLKARKGVDAANIQFAQ